jgi:hypothetical protein
MRHELMALATTILSVFSGATTDTDIFLLFPIAHYVIPSSRKNTFICKLRRTVHRFSQRGDHQAERAIHRHHSNLLPLFRVSFMSAGLLLLLLFPLTIAVLAAGPAW